MCTAAAPAAASARTAPAGSPQPVSMSTSSGSTHARRDAAHVDEHVVERRDAEVGHAERVVGDAAAGQIERVEAGALGEQRGVRIDRAGDLQGRLGGERRAKRCAHVLGIWHRREDSPAARRVASRSRNLPVRMGPW